MTEEKQNQENIDEVIPTDEEGNPIKGMKKTQQEADDVVNEETPEGAMKRLREKLDQCVKEKQEYLDGWQRAKADLINLRKRDEEERKEFVKFAKEDLVTELIPVLESFEMAKANKEAWEKIDKNWRMGVEHIHSQLLKILEGNNLKEINPKGEKFDPMRDEAVAYEPVEDKNLDHAIIEVIQKGYSFSGKILKAPRVKVGEYKG
jgi:molecular chaperone GrpE